jgi:hypothetical protein
VRERTSRAIRERGLGAVAAGYARFGTGLLTGLPRTFGGPRREFTLAGERYPYLFHRHKWTWLTERAVEVPVAQALVDGHAGGRILEVGNVLSHYRPQSHTIVDKYEHAPGILNRDVLQLDGLGPFDLVLAISTIEHVGWDEEPRDPGKALRAIRGLQALLAPGGKLMLTVPSGYHPELDRSLAAGAVEFTAGSGLKRFGPGPRWAEVPPAEVWGTPYDSLFFTARAVFFGVIECPPG